MAILKNITKDVCFTLSLNLTTESSKWMGYTLQLCIADGNETKQILELHKANELYFENFIDPEIPALCKKLDSIVNGEVDYYLFEPIDEKDFCLEIKREHDHYIASIFMEEAMVLGAYQWNAHSRIGVQMKIDINSLINFSNELREEFSSLMASFK